MLGHRHGPLRMVWGWMFGASSVLNATLRIESEGSNTLPALSAGPVLVTSVLSTHTCDLTAFRAVPTD